MIKFNLVNTQLFSLTRPYNLNRILVANQHFDGRLKTESFTTNRQRNNLDEIKKQLFALRLNRVQRKSNEIERKFKAS